MVALRDALRDLPDAVFFDLLESEDAYLLVLDVPGVSPDTLEVSIDEGTLIVEGHRRKNRPQDFEYLEEQRSSVLEAELPLPESVSGEETTADVRRGVLELTLPKESPTETTIDVTDD